MKSYFVDLIKGKHRAFIWFQHNDRAVLEKFETLNIAVDRSSVRGYT